MQKITLAVLLVVMIATPCLAEEIEPDGLFSIEGTRWRTCGISASIQFGLGVAVQGSILALDALRIAMGFMNQGIYSDWRLPKLKELECLVNYGNHNPALPFGHSFDDANQNVLWTSTTCNWDSDYAWCVSTETEESFLQPTKTSLANCWPVRGGH